MLVKLLSDFWRSEGGLGLPGRAGQKAPEPGACTACPLSEVVPGSIPSLAARALGVWALGQVARVVGYRPRPHWVLKDAHGAAEMAYISRPFWKGHRG